LDNVSLTPLVLCAGVGRPVLTTRSQVFIGEIAQMLGGFLRDDWENGLWKV